MSMGPSLALLNACLNATTGVCIFLAWRAIRAGRVVAVHRRLMLTGFTLSCVFLVSYATRIVMFGNTHFRHEGAIRYAYYFLLITHVILAMVTVPLVLRTLFLALKQRFEEHRRIARITFPIWLYVCVTGVLVYLALYQF
ncbi:MAG: DUF420 domain-containing protein [Sandaracinaceae bacterium]|jgi:uncharacterized membrane protein YozB (DUF420 family)|nr:DUF420 domain-containing protein [Sandaracinaceae bacterium]